MYICKMEFLYSHSLTHSLFSSHHTTTTPHIKKNPSDTSIHLYTILRTQFSTITPRHLNDQTVFLFWKKKNLSDTSIRLYTILPIQSSTITPRHLTVFSFWKRGATHIWPRYTSVKNQRFFRKTGVKSYIYIIVGVTQKLRERHDDE